MADKCIVKGCPNRKDQGGFIGDLCCPCYEMITTGKIKHGMTFIHDLFTELKAYKYQLKQIHNMSKGG